MYAILRICGCYLRQQNTRCDQRTCSTDSECKIECNGVTTGQTWNTVKWMIHKLKDFSGFACHDGIISDLIFGKVLGCWALHEMQMQTWYSWYLCADGSPRPSLSSFDGSCGPPERALGNGERMNWFLWYVYNIEIHLPGDSKSWKNP